MTHGQRTVIPDVENDRPALLLAKAYSRTNILAIEAILCLWWRQIADTFTLAEYIPYVHVLHQLVHNNMPNPRLA